MNKVSLSRIGVASALAFSLLLGGCLGGNSRGPTQLLTLTPDARRSTGETRTAGQGEAITVLTPTVPQASQTRRVPVYLSPTAIQYLTGATYVDAPAELFRQLLSETVSTRTGRAVLDPAQYSQVQGAVLSGQLIQFGFDPTQMQVVVLFEATVTRNQRSAASQRFEARVPVADQTAATIAPALNQASNTVAQQVADWVGR